MAETDFDDGDVKESRRSLTASPLFMSSSRASTFSVESFKNCLTSILVAAFSGSPKIACQSDEIGAMRLPMGSALFEGLGRQASRSIADAAFVGSWVATLGSPRIATSGCRAAGALNRSSILKLS